MRETREQAVVQLAEALAWRKVQTALDDVLPELATQQALRERAEAQLPKLQERAAAADKATNEAQEAYNRAEDGARLRDKCIANDDPIRQRLADVVAEARAAGRALDEAKRARDIAGREVQWLDAVARRLQAIPEPHNDLLDLLQIKSTPEPKRKR
jgi:hypothetical protein